MIYGCHHEQDMRRMGGLWKKMPVTAWTFLIGSLALAGIFPLAGFWSKDAVLTTAINESPALFGIGAIVAFMTAAYMGRAFIQTFLGEYRGGAAHHDEAEHGAGDAHEDHGSPGAGHGSGHGAHGVHASGGAEAHHGGSHTPHESPAAMTVPLVILAVLSVVVGFFSLPNGFPGVTHPGAIDHLLVGEGAPAWFPGIPEDHFNWNVAVGGTAAAFLGIFVAWMFYGSRRWSIDAFVRGIGPLHGLVVNKFWFDEFYLWLVRAVQQRFADACGWFEKNVLVGVVVNGLAAFTRWLGSMVRLLLDGHLHRYVTLALFGIVVILAYLGMRI